MQRLKKILSRILEIDEKEIDDNTSPENVSTWDSYNALSMISEIEDEFKVKFTMEEITKIRCFKHIKELLKKHKMELHE